MRKITLINAAPKLLGEYSNGNYKVSTLHSRANVASGVVSVMTTQKLTENTET